MKMEKKIVHKELKDVTMTLAQLKEVVDGWVMNTQRNGRDIHDVPVMINVCDNKFVVNRSYFGFGKHPQCGFELSRGDIFIEQSEDKRPEGGGEFWSSRGVTDGLDVSGFVVSKPAGERLRRLVNLVLENDNPESFLDYREYEPTYIQFKFKPSEFDLDLLDKLAKENNDVLTEEILRKAAKVDRKKYCKKCMHHHACGFYYNSEETVDECNFYQEPDYNKKI